MGGDLLATSLWGMLLQDFGETEDVAHNLEALSSNYRGSRMFEQMIESVKDLHANPGGRGGERRGGERRGKGGIGCH